MGVGLQHDNSSQRSGKPLPDFERLDGTIEAIPNRGLLESTCRKWDYRINRDGPRPRHVANYRDSTNSVVAQKVRAAGKEFFFLGSKKAAGLYGHHLWSDRRSIIITEGELDALSVSQAQDHKYPVVSVPNGAEGALKAIRASYDYLCEFTKIVIMFDMDEPGQVAARECADILPPDKVFIASLDGGFKDANEALVAGDPGAIISAFWRAKPYRPDGIVASSDLLDDLMDDDEDGDGIPFPHASMNEMFVGGLKQNTLTTLTAGSGVGKTTFVKELAYHLHQTHRQTVGLLMLEEQNKTTLRSIIGVHTNKNVLLDPKCLSPADYNIARSQVFPPGREMFLYNHFGSSDVDNIINRIRYLVRACNCRWIILDHLSILVSGTETNDERKLIDVAMTKLRTLVSETGIGLIVISHLKRPSGDKGHEDGAAVHLSQLRGSHSIAQLSDTVIGIQKPEDDPTGDSIQIVSLKHRLSGKRGVAATLNYDRETGRLNESLF